MYLLVPSANFLRNLWFDLLCLLVIDLTFRHLVRQQGGQKRSILLLAFEPNSS